MVAPTASTEKGKAPARAKATSSSTQKAAGNNRTSNRAPANSTITNYFLVVLCGFGLLTLYVNLTHGGVDQHHGIGSFQDQHFSKARLQSGGPDGGEHVDTVKQVVDTDDNVKQQEQDANHRHTVAGLNCDAHGGPSNEVAKEMVYWEDIPSDNTYVSPFYNPKEKQYITFESDHGGFNNIRMAMETVMAIAVASGRTLVLPPEQHFYLLHKATADGGKKQRKDFSYSHFFHMESIAQEHQGLEVITMKEFLEREAVTGHLRKLKTGQVEYPPNNRTDYDGANHQDLEKGLERYLRDVAIVPSWDPNECLASFPAATDLKHVESLKQMFEKTKVARNGKFPIFDDYVGKPTPVDGDALDRMKEMWAERTHLCIYDAEMQKAKLLHFSHGMDKTGEGARLLVHFYAFLFFEDWKQDLWMKRFVRDHVRYIDEIQCAAARIVDAVRKRARSRQADTNPNGDFDAFHIRRGDFQFKVTRFSAKDIVEMSQPELKENSTVYIATDERDKKFFDPLKKAYDVVFLDDFMHLIPDLNSNYYGMLDQLITSRSRIFFGCWFSTFTGYINRLRGYHANRDKTYKGYQDGLIPSYYYALKDRKYHMQEFYPVKKQYYAREFPTSWRGIDKGIGELENVNGNVSEK